MAISLLRHNERDKNQRKRAVRREQMVKNLMIQREIPKTKQRKSSRGRSRTISKQRYSMIVNYIKKQIHI